MVTKIKLIIDFAFKIVFGDENHKENLLFLINSFFKKHGRKPITDIEIKNPINIKTYEKDKETVLDIKGIDEDGKQYDIEVQVYAYKLYTTRTLFYTSKMITSQVKEGETYGKIKPVIHISIVDGILFDNDDNYVNQFMIYNQDHSIIYTDKVIFYTLELGKFKKDVENLTEDIDILSYLIDNSENLDEDNLPENIKDNEIVKNIIRRLKVINQTDEERELYEYKLKKVMDYETALEEKYNEGKVEGKIEGKMNEKINLTKLMKQKGYSLEEISELTGLSVEEIKNI